MKFVTSLPVVVLLAACGGSVIEEPVTTTDAGRRDSGRDARIDRVADAIPGTPDAADSYPVFNEDACPDVAAPPPMIQCDPFAQSSMQCPPGFACYPFPPQGNDPCSPGAYGTRCALGGFGLQGSPCSDGTQCAGGFICVKTGSGDQCAKLCRTDQFGQCDDGRVCRLVDVTGSGIGACD
jgi:hypothetical protein